MLVVALVALGGLASQSFADVQNIRLSGDIRTRGYLLQNAGDNGVEDQQQGDAFFISQRTRVSVEADLEDHILVVVTLKAEGLWGSSNQAVHNDSGAGSQQTDGAINKGWDVGVDEAYVQFSEIFYTPATVKLGRQYLQYGRGLIISNADQEYNFDAGRLVLDYYPLTIDLVGASVVNNQTFSSTPTYGGNASMLWLNARYEMTDSIIKDVEAYFGYMGQGSSGPVATTTAYPTSGGASPWLVGARADLTPLESLNVWAEGAYEGGGDGFAGNRGIAAYILNAGFNYTFKDVTWSPAVNGNFIWASGQLTTAGGAGRGSFIPWFDYAAGSNGYLFAPLLSNIQIFNLGVSAKPRENTTVSLQAFYYRAVDTTPGHPGTGLQNTNEDFGGLGFSPSGSSHDLGYEFDWIMGYDYSKDVRFQLVNAFFIPLNGYNYYPDTYSVAHEVRAEVNVKF